MEVYLNFCDCKVSWKGGVMCNIIGIFEGILFGYFCYERFLIVLVVELNFYFSCFLVLVGWYVLSLSYFWYDLDIFFFYKKE